MVEKIIEPFKVYVRIRPLLPNERKLVYNENNKGKKIPYQIVTSDNNRVLLKDPNNPELYILNIIEKCINYLINKVNEDKRNNPKYYKLIIKENDKRKKEEQLKILKK